MSVAPENLKALRRYLLEKTGNTESGNFGIRGEVSARRNRGYHLGRSDITGPGGLGIWDAETNRDGDYSTRRPRDRNGLSDNASAIDIKLKVSNLKALTAYLQAEARAGRLNDLAEFIGPGPDGRAYDWRKPDWKPIGPRPKGDGHEWHVHISFLRDVRGDVIHMFEGFFGKRTSEPVSAWQERLVVHGFPVTIDGVKGPETEAAIKAFQESVGLIPDGIVGPLTHAALMLDPEPEPEPVPEEPEPLPDEAELLRAQVAQLAEKIETAKQVLS